MNRIYLILLGFIITCSSSLCFAAPNANNKSEIRFSSVSQIDNEDLMNLYRFQDVQIAKVKFSGKGLWGKNFKLYVQEFIEGKPQKRQQIFDSKEDEFFKIKEQEFSFNVLAQRTLQNKVRLDFRFLGFGFSRQFPVKAEQQDFILKSAQDGEEEPEVDVSKEFNFLSFIMPYKGKQGTLRYSEFDPLKIRPEAMGKKFGIPRYFLMQIEFN